MRKIKFKKWDKIRKCFVKEGWVIHPDGKCEYPEDGFDLHGFYENENTFVLLQYTGIDDNKGNEIYEGDIVVNENTEYEVIFKNGCFFGEPRSNSEIINPIYLLKYFSSIDEKFEVVGNVYEGTKK